MVAGQRHPACIYRAKYRFLTGNALRLYPPQRPFFAYEVEGDFTFQLCIEAQFDQTFDLAGLMIEQNTEHWCKAGIEYANDR